MTFYYLKDIKKYAKLENYIPYILEENEWVVDNNNLLMDRLFGYDGEVLGATDMLECVTKISEEEVNKN